MSRIPHVLVLFAALAGCAKSEDRIAALEGRIAELERKTGEQDKSVATLARLPDEQRAVGEKVVALQASDAQRAEVLAASKAELAKMQEQLAELAAKAAAPEVEVAEEVGGGKIGIKACDRYVENYTKCIKDKVPEVAREQMLEAMDQTVKAWKEAARGPSRGRLSTACKAAADAAEQATASMGCEW